MKKNPIHLSSNLSVKMLAEINKTPEDIKRAQKRKAFVAMVLRGDVKSWFKVNKVDEQEEEGA